MSLWLITGIYDLMSNRLCCLSYSCVCLVIYCILQDFIAKLSLIGLIYIVFHITGIWTTSTQAEQTIPTPQDYGWTKELESWVPVWSTIPEVSRACRELIKCSCKGDCSTCKCGQANLDCSPLCKCNCLKQWCSKNETEKDIWRDVHSFI